MVSGLRRFKDRHRRPTKKLRLYFGVSDVVTEAQRGWGDRAVMKPAVPPLLAQPHMVLWAPPGGRGLCAGRGSRQQGALQRARPGCRSLAALAAGGGPGLRRPLTSPAFREWLSVAGKAYLSHGR